MSNVEIAIKDVGEDRLYTREEVASHALHYCLSMMKGLAEHNCFSPMGDVDVGEMIVEMIGDANELHEIVSNNKNIDKKDIN